MRETGWILLFAACAMLLIAGVLFGLHDTSTLTSPPEAVAEGFAREIVAGRYERAVPYLSSSVAERLPIDSLRSFRSTLLELLRGEALDIRGEPRTRGADTASAAASIESNDTTITLIFPLRLEEGEWKVGGLRMKNEE